MAADPAIYVSPRDASTHPSDSYHTRNSFASPRGTDHKIIEHPMPRLRDLVVKFDAFMTAATDKKAQAVSAIFLALIHHAPSLEKFTYGQMHASRGTTGIRLFSAIKN